MRFANQRNKEIFDDLKELREQLCHAYTSSKGRTDSGFNLIQEAKEDLNNLKAYVGMEFLISPDKKGDLVDSLTVLYGNNRELISNSGFYPQCVTYDDYQVKNDEGKFVTDPNYAVVRFVLEANEGDYKALTSPLTEAEEDAMRSVPNAKEITRAEEKAERASTRLGHYS